MQNGPNSSRLPEEADLLAWVEGETLSSEASAAVARALMADPAMARRMELMKADRLALRSLGEERAPKGLLDSVEAALQPVLERELLLGLKGQEPSESMPVVSMVRQDKRGIFQTFLADRAGRRMALAASLLVLIGGATWWATVTVLHGPKQPVGPVAIRESQPDAPETTIAMKSDAREQAKVEPGAIAMNDATSAPAATMVEIPGAEPAPMVLSAAEVVGPVKSPIDAALAAELARERKLVIRVVSREATLQPRRLCDRIMKEFDAPAWKLASDAPTTELASVLEARPLEISSRSAPRVVEPGQPAMAAMERSEPIVGPPVPREIEATVIEPEPQPVYVVQARLDAVTMGQLKTTLEKASMADEVVFEERYEALPLESGSVAVMTPAAVLWWTNPPAGWTSWGEVPVVIQAK